MGYIRPILQNLLSALFVGFILFSCSDSIDEIVPAEKRVICNISFRQEIIPIFNQHCIFCHSKAHTIEHYYTILPYLTPSVAYYELISGGYVDTISPEQSILYLRVEGTSVGINMPPSGKLSSIEIQRILNWIKDGACNN